MVLSSLFCLFCSFPGHGTGHRRVVGDQSEKIRLTLFWTSRFFIFISLLLVLLDLVLLSFIEEKHAKKKGRYLNFF